MIISEFGYQRAVSQVEKVSDLCRRASLKNVNPQVLRELREIRNEVEVIKETLADNVKPDPIKPPKAGKPATIATEEPSGSDEPPAA